MPFPTTLPADVLAAGNAAQVANSKLAGADALVNDLSAQLAAATADEATVKATARQSVKDADAAFQAYVDSETARLESERQAFDAAMTEAPIA